MGTDVEVAVIGGGVMGACVAWRAALGGRDAHVFEQFDRGHVHGSSHGTARIFRLAYPDADYVAMARTALPLWDELEAASGVTVRSRTGELDHGDPAEIAAITANLADAGLDHEVLTPAEVAARWPGLTCDRTAVFHPQGGTVDATATVLAALDVATSRGATVHDRCPVEHLEVAGDAVVLHTESGKIRARRAVVAAGAWVGSVLGEVMGVSSGATSALPEMVVTREQPVHFERRPDCRRGPSPGEERAIGDVPWPSFIHWSDAGPTKTSGVTEPVWGYGMQTPDGRIKVGEHHTGEVVARIGPGRRDRPPVDDVAPIDQARLERLRAYAQRWLPGVDPETAEPERCLYTSTASTDFVIDRVGPVVVAAGFSGHGFKFAPAVGELVAGMLAGTSVPPTRFALHRAPCRTGRGSTPTGSTGGAGGTGPHWP